MYEGRLIKTIRNAVRKEIITTIQPQNGEGIVRHRNCEHLFAKTPCGQSRWK